MSCDRAAGVDIEAFLIDVESEALAAFRAHFPSCPDCSAAVARWRTSDPGLRPNVRPAATRDFDVEGEANDVRSPLRGYFEWLSETLSLQPMALAAVSIALVVGFGVWLSGGMDDPIESSSTTRRVTDAPSPAVPRAEMAGAKEDAGLQNEVLITALTKLPPPIYDAPPGLDSRRRTEQFGPVRGGRLPSLVAQAPDHVGLTMSSAPTLWWRLDRATDLPIEITVVDDDAIEPILRIDLPGPHTAGLHSISLAEHSVRLQPDLSYRWVVTMLVDRDRPSRNPVSEGSIRVVPESDARRVAAESSTGAEQGHLLARNGLWYDAYDFFAALSVAHPEVPMLDRYRERMMEMATAER